MSSDDILISVQNVGKCYLIYDHPRDRLKQYIFPRLQKLLGRPQKKYFREFWALRDISFDVKRGETIGIIGRNGAGKSTLLQMICGTMQPTSGSTATHGRIAALLELGAGFNPEFTGRENVFMNAAILGLSREETEARLEDILAFAEIGDFIDQPVKTYSSGMYVRLAFSVAVNVDPQILIVDEALSVGDLSFQNKCIMKIRELRAKGTTLLFVAHDLSIVQTMCDRVIWLQRDKPPMMGESIAVCQEYYATMTGTPLTKSPDPSTIIPQKDTGLAKFIEIEHDGRRGEANPVYSVGDKMTINFTLQAFKDMGRSVFTISIFRADNDWSIGQTSQEEKVWWEPCKAGDQLKGKIVLSPLCLAPGDYTIAIGCNSEDLTVFYALSDLSRKFSVRWNYPTWGKFLHPCEWVPLHRIPAAEVTRTDGQPALTE